jgi:hypothetical protein
MWRQRPLHVAFTAQEPVAYQPQGLIGLKSASMPQHEMLADAGESGQNAKIFPTREISTSSMQTGNARHARPAGSIDEWVLLKCRGLLLTRPRLIQMHSNELGGSS